MYSCTMHPILTEFGTDNLEKVQNECEKVPGVCKNECEERFLFKETHRGENR